MWKGKHILLGITGSIAAYKAATLVRLLTKAGAEVQVIMTDTARQFITPLTMATLSKHPVLVEFYNPENGDWNNHVSLGEWADLYLIAPATANTIAKMQHGIADNLLLTAYLSARCPVVIAPAMDVEMYNHPANQDNIARLKTRGVTVIEPAAGSLASGLDGKGRMEDPEKIFEFVSGFFAKKKTFANRKILVTAGPTYEAIDPVRFIGNHSSGKMGFAIAEELAARGAAVTLVTGATALKAQHAGITVISVVSAAQMHAAVVREFETAEVAVLCAAVADFTPEYPSDKKIKRGNDALQISLKPTIDIAAALGCVKAKTQRLVGFALETDNEVANANKKMQAKNLDLIVLNSLRDEGAGFATDTNKVTLIYRDGTHKDFALKSKNEVAIDIVDAIQSLK
ncbi:MAG: bifunctional phosphopantothenoylcysteine decarboxylase/phosphopantothenate--cysteine ligase CoaBC [Prevotellaceae bacterium]|jgi:phosphopantothenoylcysteine decarboxylase/phosphopantothenate--cysteine ligase|nr:bifunctional phosphopantothenoylcysteine decarboxylase/phosphopantothenate--cysteine ligase CoaBC [Prevotellaceae bacterium]